MLKTEAIDLLGGTIPAAAKAIGISYQAVDKWPEVLTDAIRDRVQAVLYRRVAPDLAHLAPELIGTEAPAQTEQGA